MIVEVAQISTKEASIKRNTDKIISSIERAKKDGVDLVVFPELTIPGYSCMDWVLHRDFVRQNIEALHIIKEQTQGIAAIVGFIDQNENKLGPDGTPLRYNSAAFLRDGRLMGVVDKTLYPEYDVFSEKRYYSQIRREKRKLFQFDDLKIGTEICEDLWKAGYREDVTDNLIFRGADVIINLSASPFYVDKRKIRATLIEEAVSRYHKPFIYTNLVGSQDGYDGQLVFDGQSMVYGADGRLIGLGKAFEEDHFLVDLDNPKSVEERDQLPIEQIHNALVLGVKEYFHKAGTKKAVIGLSGGIDSAVTAALAVEALGKENVMGIAMPSQFSSEGSVEDARELAENLEIDFEIIPIAETHSELSKAVKDAVDGEIKDLTNQNIQARVRGAILMGYANDKGAIVLSTGNKTETALGYTTLYGDMCGGLAVISDVDKLKVYELAKFINKKSSSEIIPDSTITKEPSAELTADQTDERSLGGNYEVIVPIVNAITENRATVAQLSRDYPRELVQHLWQLIQMAEFKRRQGPPGIKVTGKSFGIGRRYPMSHGVVYL